MPHPQLAPPKHIDKGFMPAVWLRKQMFVQTVSIDKFKWRLRLQYGRQAIADIAKEVEGKTEAEVAKYSKKFWKRYGELNDAERIIKNIERGEQRIQRQQDIMTALASKLERYRNPWQELRLQYGANKGKAYTGKLI
jgi:hypothetical protein